MSALQHRFIGGIRIDNGLEYRTVRQPVAWNRLHLQQGELDGACGVYCLLMANMLLTGMSRKEAERVAMSKQGPWHEFASVAREHFFSGMTGHMIAKHVETYLPELRCDVVPSRDRSVVTKALQSALQRDGVALAWISARGLEHWIVVSGLEYSIHGRREVLEALLALDPAEAAPCAHAFNARLALRVPSDLRKRPAKRFAYVYRHASGASWNATIHQVIVLERALLVESGKGEAS